MCVSSLGSPALTENSTRPTLTASFTSVSLFKFLILSQGFRILSASQARNQSVICKIYSISQGPGRTLTVYSSGATEESLIRPHFTAVQARLGETNKGQRASHRRNSGANGMEEEQILEPRESSYSSRRS